MKVDCMCYKAEYPEVTLDGVDQVQVNMKDRLAVMVRISIHDMIRTGFENIDIGNGADGCGGFLLHTGRSFGWYFYNAKE
eukprot:c47247_g1_i1 orf=2-238(-)